MNIWRNFFFHEKRLHTIFMKIFHEFFMKFYEKFHDFTEWFSSGRPTQVSQPKRDGWPQLSYQYKLYQMYNHTIKRYLFTSLTDMCKANKSNKHTIKKISPCTTHPHLSFMYINNSLILYMGHWLTCIKRSNVTRWTLNLRNSKSNSNQK
jgi:hypothetical protein